MNAQWAEVLRAVGNVAIFWSATVGMASVFVHSRVAWWRTEMGRHLMAYMLVVGTVLLLSSIRIAVGDAPWFGFLRFIVFLFVPVVMTQRLWLQLKAQRQLKRDRERETR